MDALLILGLKKCQKSESNQEKESKFLEDILAFCAEAVGSIEVYLCTITKCIIEWNVDEFYDFYWLENDLQQRSCCGLIMLED